MQGFGIGYAPSRAVGMGHCHSPFRPELVISTLYQNLSIVSLLAEVWFENEDAENYEILEHCAHGRAGEALVLIYMTTPMMDAGFDPNVGDRRYNEFGSYIPRRAR